MRSKFWEFLEVCDQTTSVRAVRDLLNATSRLFDLDGYLLATHGVRRDLGSLAVLVHNWPTAATDHMFTRRFDGLPNPIFEAAERTGDALAWSSVEWQASLRRDQRQWLDGLSDLLPGEGVSQAMKSTVVTASCSAIAPRQIPADQMKAWMRIANYAYHQIQFLQRPKLSEPERLTAREHECLYRAAVNGERPSTVARRLGVKVSTVRTLRQKAYGRLDAGSAEQAIWRMLETGQLFRSGRKSKPRAR